MGPGGAPCPHSTPGPGPSLAPVVRVESLAPPRGPPSWGVLSAPGFGWPGHWPLAMASGGCRPGLRPQRRLPLQLRTQALRGGAVHDPASPLGSLGPKPARPLAGAWPGSGRVHWTKGLRPLPQGVSLPRPPSWAEVHSLESLPNASRTPGPPPLLGGRRQEAPLGGENSLKTGRAGGTPACCVQDGVMDGRTDGGVVRSPAAVALAPRAPPGWVLGLLLSFQTPAGWAQPPGPTGGGGIGLATPPAALHQGML